MLVFMPGNTESKRPLGLLLGVCRQKRLLFPIQQREDLFLCARGCWTSGTDAQCTKGVSVTGTNHLDIKLVLPGHKHPISFRSNSQVNTGRRRS